MNQTTFSLKAFPPSNLLPQIQIGGRVNRQSDTLAISYKINGDISQIYIPAINKNASRQSDLWETTCLEFFLGIQNSPVYWEFNLAPSGEWNVYRFTDYRTGMVEEEAIAKLPFEVSISQIFRLNLSLDLGSLIKPDVAIDLGITAVIESRQGEISYWALTHCLAQPDFHVRDSFTIAT